MKMRTFCTTMSAALANLTKLEITRCPALVDVCCIERMTRLVELGLYECPAVRTPCITDLRRLVHLSLDLSRAYEMHLEIAAIPLVGLHLISDKPIDNSILESVGSITKWLMAEWVQPTVFPRVTVAYGASHTNLL